MTDTKNYNQPASRVKARFPAGLRSLTIVTDSNLGRSQSRTEEVLSWVATKFYIRLI